MTLRAFAPAIIAVLIVCSPLPAAEPGFADPVLGRWDLTVDGPEGPYPSWVEIRLRTENELMAAFVGRFGSKRYAADVDYAEGRLEFRVPVQYEAGGDELRFSGTLSGGRLSGVTRLDAGPGYAWTGVPAPGLARGEPAAWGDELVLIGRGLDGWHAREDAHAGCWRVDNGVLSATPPCVDLVSEPLFDDFRLELEFRYPPGSNSGVYLRGRYEVQIQDDLGKAPDPLRFGGLYGFIAPDEIAALAPGQWQSMVVTLIGRRVSVLLNDRQVIRDREIPGITGGALDSDEGSPGPLMLQGDHGPIEFRNIIVTPAVAR